MLMSRGCLVQMALGGCALAALVYFLGPYTGKHRHFDLSPSATEKLVSGACALVALAFTAWVVSSFAIDDNRRRRFYHLGTGVLARVTAIDEGEPDRKGETAYKVTLSFVDPTTKAPRTTTVVRRSKASAGFEPDEEVPLLLRAEEPEWFLYYKVDPLASSALQIGRFS
jgi:hypothetical protein